MQLALPKGSWAQASIKFVQFSYVITVQHDHAGCWSESIAECFSLKSVDPAAGEGKSRDKGHYQVSVCMKGTSPKSRVF